MACKRSAVRSRLPPPTAVKTRSPSSRGLGHRPFTAVTGVRIPVGTPDTARRATHGSQAGGMKPAAVSSFGVVVQLVRIPACHAGGRGFESRPLRQNQNGSSLSSRFFRPYFLVHTSNSQGMTSRPVRKNDCRTSHLAPPDTSAARLVGPWSSLLLVRAGRSQRSVRKCLHCV